MASNQQLEKPKRAKSSYMLFCDEKRPAVMEANRIKNGGKVKMPELGKELSELWSTLGAEDKAKYEKMAAEEKQKHDEAKKAFVESTKIEGLMKRPQSAYFQFINANRANIQEEHKLTSIGDVAKKATELWKALPEEEKKPYEDQYQKDKAIYEAWKESDEGKAALAKQKAMKDSAKEEDTAAAKKGGNKRDASTGNDDEKPAKKVKTVATPNRRGKASAGGATATPPKTQLSETILSKCISMGDAGSGVSYQSLMVKLLATDGLENVDQERALEMLKDNNGLLNKVRPLLLPSCGA